MADIAGKGLPAITVLTGSQLPPRANADGPKSHRGSFKGLDNPSSPMPSGASSRLLRTPLRSRGGGTSSFSFSSLVPSRQVSFDDVLTLSHRSDPSLVKELDISGRGYRRVGDGVLDQFPELISVDAGDNRLSLEDFASAVSLVLLRLHCNGIRQLHFPDVHNIFLNLSVLDLSFNHLSDAELVPLSGLPNLKELDLGCNDLELLAPFPPMSQLIVLVLSRNPISSISTLDLPMLEELSLSHTPLTVLDCVPEKLESVRFINVCNSSIAEPRDLSVSPLMSALTIVDCRNTPLDKEYDYVSFAERPTLEIVLTPPPAPEPVVDATIFRAVPESPNKVDGEGVGVFPTSAPSTMVSSAPLSRNVTAPHTPGTPGALVATAGEFDPQGLESVHLASYAMERGLNTQFDRSRRSEVATTALRSLADRLIDLPPVRLPDSSQLEEVFSHGLQNTRTALLLLRRELAVREPTLNLPPSFARKTASSMLKANRRKPPPDLQRRIDCVLNGETIDVTSHATEAAKLDDGLVVAEALESYVDELSVHLKKITAGVGSLVASQKEEFDEFGPPVNIIQLSAYQQVSRLLKDAQKDYDSLRSLILPDHDSLESETVPVSKEGDTETDVVDVENGTESLTIDPIPSFFVTE